MSMRNSLAALEGISALAVAGTVNTDGTSTVLAPLATASDVVTAKSSTGVFTITITPFKGPQGLIIPVVCPTTASGIVQVYSSTYTGDSVVITVKTFAVDGTTATDKQFNFHVLAA